MKTIETEKVFKYLIEHHGACEHISCKGKKSAYENVFNFEACPMFYYCSHNQKAVGAQMKEREILAIELLEALEKLKYLEGLEHD
jgi:hypothetical protein